MATSLATFSSNLTFALAKANTGFSNTALQTSSTSFNLNGLSLTTFNQVFAKQYTLAASASQTVDLTSLTNLVNEAFSFGHLLTIIIKAVGSECTVSPGASNPQQWFFGTTTDSVVIEAGGMLAYSGPATATGSAVSGSHKTLLFTNSGLTSLTLTVVILGSTI